MDVKSAFLNGDLNEEIYVDQPPEFIVAGFEKVYLLKRALYGLEQAPRAWYHKIHTFLINCGFICSHADSNLYVLLDGNIVALLIILYVDDRIITRAYALSIGAMKKHLSSQFEMTDLGLLHFYLGMEVWQFKDRIFISQFKYVQ